MKKNIKILENTVAQKIAAGEVIDRPASAVRELLDNAIDSECSEISLYIESGGIALIRVIDDGCGMGKEDLELCTLPHATSKIESAEDLFKIETLGFRGEALSSIASSSRLEITSSESEDGSGYGIKTDSTGKQELFPVKSRKGTSVTVKDLFYSLPARKQFLKTPSAETGMCTTVFLEKAAAAPGIAFRMFIDNKPKYILKSSSHAERILACYSSAAENIRMIHETAHVDVNYKIKMLLIDPELYRKDRKYIHIYLNGRRIQDYSLMQALMYGYSPVMPAGHFPAAFVFIENSPELVDFNIHPAKKEARIKNISQIHHSISETVKNHFLGFNKKQATVYDYNEKSGPLLIQTLDSRTAEKVTQSDELPAPEIYSAVQVSEEKQIFADFKYFGQLFELFLICEKNESLYLIDQHAAHEKILYEKLNNSKPDIQKLLLPYYLKNTTELSEVHIEKYRQAGIIIEKDDTGGLYIDSMPALLMDIKNSLAELIEKSPGNTDNLVKELYASAACRKAVKQGDKLSAETAIQIISDTFRLKTPYCPHGRPVWEEITKKKLLEKINRII